jgi:hypothetical protein
MATWEDVRQYIHTNYRVADEAPGVVRMIFDLGNGRAQNVFVSSKAVGAYEYLSIWTPVCHESRMPARDALVRNADLTLGALALAPDGTMILRQSVPLKDLDIDEFEVPLRTLTQLGDMLEQQYAVADQY